jgi:hypothetical protein
MCHSQCVVHTGVLKITFLGREGPGNVLLNQGSRVPKKFGNRRNKGLTSEMRSTYSLAI